MSKIIVSYRRADSTAIAGRIFDRLVDRYGEESVFMDIDKIPFGTDFRHHIQDVLRGANLLLAVVGPNWLGRTADGRSRIQDEADPVRVEVEAALKQGMTVIPVLVGNAAMPGAADLPESLRDFAYINAAPIDDGRDFHQHMDRLVRSIDAILGSPQPAAPAPAASGRRTIAGIVIAVVVLAGGVLALAPELIFRRAPPTKDQSDTPAQPGVAKPPVPEPAPAPPAVEKRVPNIDDLVTPKKEPAQKPSPPANATYRVLANVSGGVQNLRSGPAVKYPIVVAIPAGATGIALGACRPAEDNTRPWCIAQWRTYSGWISSCCIVDERTGAPPRIN